MPLKYVFGPVPSRRLGRSLGIDPVPLKTCNWNCVYCQLGRTVPLTNRRRETVPTLAVLDQLRAALCHPSRRLPDWVTFVGSGEPALHSRLGEMIRRAKQLSDAPVAVITNGALLYREDVRRELALADAVLPTLDAGNPDLYRRINRPHPEVTFERFLKGLIAFRRSYSGRLWVEVMLVRGLNDTTDALRGIAAMLARVGPDEVHINLPTRPPAETWVSPADDAGVRRAVGIFGALARVVQPTRGSFEISADDEIVDAVVAVITRHPIPQGEMERLLDRLAPGDAPQIMEALRASGLARTVERHHDVFWIPAAAHFPGAKASEQSRLSAAAREALAAHGRRSPGQ
jgi:wyosine [tRNA(Phe)-imidazoG37] synthetase (radical SAM superfamily)